jgi:DeoR/GlpR family transcriptional regulator of sugar metabolism
LGSLDEFSREQTILTTLRSCGRVAVNDLARQLGVSAVTVRKDLDSLERRSLLRRVRGGAVGAGGPHEGSFETRLRDSRTTKQAIARAAAELVDDGDVIAIDSSTTAFYLAYELLDRRNLLVVTNSLRVTTLLAEQSSARVLVLGGVLRRSAGSLVGPLGDVVASRGRIAKGFFGLVGLSPIHGLMDISAEETYTKQALAKACVQVFGLFHSVKVRGFGVHPFAAPGMVTGLYTDDGAPPEFVRQWAGLGVPVTLTSVHSDAANVVRLPSPVQPGRRP